MPICLETGRSSISGTQNADNDPFRHACTTKPKIRWYWYPIVKFPPIHQAIQREKCMKGFYVHSRGSTLKSSLVHDMTMMMLEVSPRCCRLLAFHEVNLGGTMVKRIPDLLTKKPVKTALAMKRSLDRKAMFEYKMLERFNLVDLDVVMRSQEEFGHCRVKQSPMHGCRIPLPSKCGSFLFVQFLSMFAGSDRSWGDPPFILRL